MNIIIFDFEVFKKDTLLGCIILNEGEETLVQLWDLNEIKKFYNEHKKDIWIGHNNEYYDNLILQSIIRNKDPYETSVNLIERNKKEYLNIELYYYDLMKFHMGSLKSIEAFVGKNISETEVSFDLDRPLTEKEKLLTESYNRDDLNQTLEDFEYLKDEFMLRLDIIKEFNLTLNELCVTEAKLASKVLKAKKIDDIAYRVINPIKWKNLQIKNQDILKYYLNREYAQGKSLEVTLCGTPHKIQAGGIHGALNNIYRKECYYLDVSGYYNLIMINFNLLPRSIPEEGRQLYEYMYHEQLRLKKINPRKRAVYKIILLAVFGAMNNEYCEFYDPYQGDLVRLTGQMFLSDLLEKMEGKIECLQSNTDGIMLNPLPGHTVDEIKAITDEWCERTGFVLKFEKIYDLFQRDVNNYIYKDEKGEIHVKGEAVKYYNCYDNPFTAESYRSKEPMIISKCIVEFLLNGKTPEEIIEENKLNLKMFQYIAKKNSFDWLEYEESNSVTGEVKIIRLQNVNRVFALKSKIITGMVYKRRKEGKLQKSKVSNLPPNVFVFNENISDITRQNKFWDLIDIIDYDYYVRRAYERIEEFVG